MQQIDENSPHTSWYFIIYRVNCTLEEILEALSKINEIEYFNIRISDYRKKDYNKRDGIFIGYVYEVSEDLLDEVARKILDCIKGDAKIWFKEVITGDNINNPTIPVKIHHYYGKDESLWGLKIHRLGRKDWDFNQLKDWLNKVVGNRYSIINHDKQFVNILIWGQAFVIRSPFFDFNEMVFADIVPYLAGPIKNLRFPEYDNGIEYKIVEIKRPPLIVDNSDDTSVDPRFW